MKLSVCVETVYTDRALSRRVAAVRQHGIDSFELWSLDEHSTTELREVVAANDCRLMLFCGNRQHSLVDPEQRAGFVDELAANLSVAQELNCPLLNLLSDAVDRRGIPIAPASPISKSRRLESLHDGLTAAAALAESTGVQLVVEPLNSVLDHPGYTLDHSADAFEIVRSIGQESLKVLFDIYHMQMMQVDVPRAIEDNLEWIGHVHIADAPGRHEPGTGAMDSARLAQTLLTNNYAGYVGLECIPVACSDKAIQEFVTVFAPELNVAAG